MVTTKPEPNPLGLLGCKAQPINHMKPTDHEIHALACQFAQNSPNLDHGDLWDAMGEIGGGTAILYGAFRATPIQHVRKRRNLRNSIIVSLHSLLDEN
jgi:hypothetical protein